MDVNQPIYSKHSGGKAAGEEELTTSRKVALVVSMVACQLVQVI